MHAPLTQDVYVEPPPEYFDTNFPDHTTKDVVWKLKKAINGLKESPRAWQEHLWKVLEQQGLRRLKSDANVYVHDELDIYLLVYVDDLLFFGDQQKVDKLAQDLQKEVLLKIIGRLEPGK